MDQQIPELSLMRQGITYRFPVKIRGFIVQLRPLTMDETTNSALEVAEQLAKMPIEQRTPFQEAVIYSRVILKYASNSEPGKNDPKLSDLVLGAMTPDEVNHAYQQYLDGINKCNPSYDALKVDTLNRLVEEIKKNPSELTASSLLQALANTGLVLISLAD